MVSSMKNTSIGSRPAREGIGTLYRVFGFIGILTAAVVVANCSMVSGQVIEQLTNGDFEDVSGTFPNGWTITAAGPGMTSGLAGSTHAAVMYPDTFGGRITEGGLKAAAQWDLDMYFASAAPPTVDDRSLQLVLDSGSGLINIRVNGGGSVQSFDGTNWQDLISNAVTFSTDSTLDGDFDDAGDTQNVHRLHIAGDFTTSATYTVQLSAVGSNTFSMTSGPVSFFDSGKPPAGSQLGSVSVRSQLSMAPYVVDQISLMAAELVNPPFTGLNNGDFEDVSGAFPKAWTIVRGTPTQHAGFGGTTTAAYLHKLAQGGDRITQTPASPPGPKWELDLLFATEDPGGNADRGLNIILGNNVGSGNLNLRVNGDGSVQTVTSTPTTTFIDVPNLSNAVQFSVDANGDGDFSDVGDTLNVYHMVLRGDYSTATPSYTVLLSQANQTALTLNGTTNLWFTASPTAGSSISSVSISAQNSNGAYVVDQLFLRSLSGIPGDYNGDGAVNGADYVVWRDNLNTTNTLPNDTSPGNVTSDDYTVWRANFGSAAGGTASSVGQAAAVPESATLLLLAIGVAVGGCCINRRASNRNSRGQGVFGSLTVISPKRD